MRTRPRCAGTGRVRDNTTAAGWRGGARDPAPWACKPALRGGRQGTAAAGGRPWPTSAAFKPLPSLPSPGKQTDHFLESTYGNLHFAKKVNAVGISNVLGLRQVEDIIDTPYSMLKASERSLG